MTDPILLSGFAPFDDETVNPSWEAVLRLAGEDIDGHRVAVVQLPVSFGESLASLRQAIEDLRPGLVLCVGQAGGRSRVSLERVAINLQDARIPDNAGAQPIDEAVEPAGPTAYFSSLPLKAMLRELMLAGIPAEISHSAGTYVCNHVFYGLMHALRDEPAMRGGFLHVPYIPEQAVRHPGAPSLALDYVVQALRIALRAALATREDLRISGGSEC
jgi:pyroglutamyl-peptidase